MRMKSNLSPFSRAVRTISMAVAPSSASRIIAFMKRPTVFSVSINLTNILRFRAESS